MQHCHDRIVDQLSERGYAISDHYIAEDVMDGLIAEANRLRCEDEFRPARVGKGEQAARHPEIRSDRIFWLDPVAPGSAQQHYLHRLEHLRETLNRSFFLGLFEFEGHFAHYPPGTFYHRHFDCFRESPHRLVTCVLYLNRDWQAADGGQLQLYIPQADGSETSLLIEPNAGRLVTFLSERFPHEVLPASKDRLSLTGWFRRRPLAVESSNLFLAIS